MFRSLGCLAAAMIGTSWLLSWMEPEGLSLRPAVSADELHERSSSAVRESRSIDARRWREVQVIAGPASAASAQRLSAMPDSSESHFVIDDEGRVRSLRRWRDQQPSSAAPHTVRVQVSQVRRDAPMTEAQWVAVQALVAALTQEISPKDDSLPIRLEDTWARVHGLESGTVLRLTPAGRS